MDLPEKLTVTVIPLEANMDPYEIILDFYSDNEKNLK